MSATFCPRANILLLWRITYCFVKSFWNTIYIDCNNILLNSCVYYSNIFCITSVTLATIMNFVYAWIHMQHIPRNHDNLCTLNPSDMECWKLVHWRFGLWTSGSVYVSVCQRFGLARFWLATSYTTKRGALYCNKHNKVGFSQLNGKLYWAYSLSCCSP